MRSNTAGGYNSAGGGFALYQNTTGQENTAFGYSALFDNTTGNWNTAQGVYALHNNTTGHSNAAMGYYSLRSNTTGTYNTATGFEALRANTTGYNNTATGYHALESNTTGFYNIGLGFGAGALNTSGTGNIFIGTAAGYNETGSNRLYIGNDYNKTTIYANMATGQVLLGTPDPTGYVFKGTRTLNVVGGIITDSVRVALSGNWADHVFADSYKLKPLQEVEGFITANKHLPNIPSAKDVNANGINLAEMNAKLLEKVEELTLYMIAQQKQIDELQKLVKNK
jgi:hypothetical protein